MAKRRRWRGSGTLFKRDPKGPWYAGWKAHTGKRVTRSTGTTDRAVAERMLAKWVSDAKLRSEGVIDPTAESLAIEGRRAIAEHVTDWEAALRAKGITERRVAVVMRQARRVLADCRFRQLADVNAARVRRWMADRLDEGDAPRTVNGHLQAMKQLLRWAVDERRLATSPLAGVSRVRVVGQTFSRRPLSPEELAYLLEATEAGPTVRRMSGPLRAMLYRVATGTGFRAAELASLTPEGIDLDADPPAVTVRAAYSKRRRDDRQPIREDLAARLRPWLADRPRGQPVFQACNVDRLAAVVRADVRRARARWIRATPDRAERRRRRDSDFLRDQDSEGRRVDFHALRATYITMLVKSGASVREAQELARHSDPRLTMNVYTRLGVHDLAGALDRLPSVDGTDDRPERAAATGTHGREPDGVGAQRMAQRIERESAEPGATGRELRLAGSELGDERKPRLEAGSGGSARSGAAQRGKATRGTRTPDLSFTKAPLYQLS
jgi:integrase